MLYLVCLWPLFENLLFLQCIEDRLDYWRSSKKDSSTLIVSVVNTTIVATRIVTATVVTITVVIFKAASCRILDSRLCLV